jgi:hypothetical protein
MFRTPQRMFLAAAVLSAAALFTAACTVTAAEPTPANAALLAERVTWRGFIDYWTSWANSSSRIIQIVSLVGLVAIGLICSGKWLNKK